MAHAVFSKLSPAGSTARPTGARLLLITILAVAALPAGTARATTAAACVGVQVSPSQSLQTAVDTHRVGTTFCIKAGVHRLVTAVVPRAHDRFIGAPGAVLSGAKDISRSFVPSGRYWKASGQTENNPATPGVCNPGFLCTTANDVYLDDKPLRQVASMAKLSSGRVFFDHAAHQIYIANNPSGHRVEAGVATRAFRGFQTNAIDVTIQGLIIEKFANEGGNGAINATGGWDIEQNEVRLNHGIGVQGGLIIRGNNIHDNGELGISVYGDNHVVVENNKIAYNNYAGYGTSWEAGGAKFMRTTNLTVSGNYVHHNHGIGLGSDSDNVDTVYKNNRVEDNSGAGIVIETSYKTLIIDNTLRNNGSAFTGGLSGAGIYINTSQDVDITKNVVDHNLQGIGIFSTDRGSGPHGKYVTKNNYVHDNKIILRAKGSTGLTSYNLADYTQNNNRFQSNHYTLCGPAYFAVWNGKDGYKYADAKAWVAAGFDTTGTFAKGC